MKSHQIKSAAQPRVRADIGEVGAKDVSRGGLFAAWARFWFTPADARGFHTLRLFAGLLFLFWLLAFRGYVWPPHLGGHFEDLFGLNGWFDVQAYQEAARLYKEFNEIRRDVGDARQVEPTFWDVAPPFGWSLLYVVGANSAALVAFYWASALVLLLFALGVAPRLTSLLTWLVLVSFTAHPVVGYSADKLLVMFAFCFLVGYLLYGQWGRRLSLVERFFGPWDAFAFRPLLSPQPDADGTPPSHAANLAVRLLQVHFAVVVVALGLMKLQWGDWWSGVALWFPLHPPYETTAEGLAGDRRASNAYLFFLSVATYAVLAWQIAFPLFAWRRGWWRLLLLGGSVVGWLGCIVIWRLPLFGPLFVLGSLCFLTPEEWHGLRDGLRRLLGGAQRAGKPAVAPTGKGAKVTNTP